MMDAMIVETLQNAKPFLIVSCFLGGILTGLGLTILYSADPHSDTREEAVSARSARSGFFPFLLAALRTSVLPLSALPGVRLPAANDGDIQGRAQAPAPLGSDRPPSPPPGEGSSRPTRRPAGCVLLRGAVKRCAAHSGFVPLLLLPVLPACRLACAPLRVDHRLLLPVHPTRRLPACTPVRVHRYRPLPLLYLSLLCRGAHFGIASICPPGRQPARCERRKRFVRAEG